MTRREAMGLLGSVVSLSITHNAFAAAKGDSSPPLAPGVPTSAERMALIDAFKRQSDGLEKRFGTHTHKSDVVMPYRLFQPQAAGRLPLVMYLHGSGGLGDDNEKQLAGGNMFGSRLWALPENQKRFPCYILAPQTDRGWIRYDFSKEPAQTLPGLGNDNRLALEIVDRLCREFPVDQRRIYVTGQSMGGAGAWNALTYRPKFFAAAVICCGSASADDGTKAIDTPLWNFHGDSDKTVPASVSRDRIAARRKAGGRPLSTEYAGVDHNSWQWAYTEPELVKWVFSHRRTN